VKQGKTVFEVRVEERIEYMSYIRLGFAGRDLP
jgi:hypothetical protein